MTIRVFASWAAMPLPDRVLVAQPRRLVERVLPSGCQTIWDSAR